MHLCCSSWLVNSTLPHSTFLKGRVTTMDLPIDNESSLPLTSMYVPSQPLERGRFLGEGDEKKLLKRRTILGMDANCVENTAVDVKYTPGSSTTYANAYGSTLRSLLARLKLVDVHRLLNGNAPAFTRMCDTVFTRIDRLCAPKVPTPHEWLTLKRTTFGKKKHLFRPLCFRSHHRHSLEPP